MHPYYNSLDKRNAVFIATSLDGYIADKNGGLDWLNTIPNPDGIDMGYNDFMSGLEALVMGRATFETVCSFDVPWPYSVPVFVLSRTHTKLPTAYQDKAEYISGPLVEVLETLNDRGYQRLYIDGGKTIQGFLKEDLIDEMIITTIPVLLGDGVRLFSELPQKLDFELVNSKVFLQQIVQNHYKRKRC